MSNPAPESEHLDGYPVVIAIPIAWGEMDSYAPVNNGTPLAQQS